MRHKILLCLFAAMGVLTAASAQKVSLNFQGVPLEQVLTEITRQTGFTFAYSQPAIDVGTTVSVSVKDEALPATLDRLLAGTGIAYEIGKKKVLLFAKPKAAPAVGATTNAPSSPVGTLGDVMELEDVVVTGYGSVRKRDVTTSISSIRASEIENMAVSSIEQALVGRMAGVQITQPNGTPGAGFHIKVRGVGTITAGGEPLYVIDGVPLSDDVGNATSITVSPLASIDPSDIESIEILKDASAAAIYGSRGSNGVVIITTKKGAEGKPVVKYSGRVGAQTVTKKIDVLDAYEYAQLVFDAHNAAYYEKLNTAGKAGLYDPWATNQDRWDILSSGAIATNQDYMIPPELLPYVQGEPGLTNTDWQDAVLRTGLMQKHNLSVSGGTKQVKYLLSGSYQDEEGVVINSAFTKMGFRTKVDVEHEKWRIGGNINLTRNVYDLVNTEGRYSDDGVLSAALVISPAYPVRNEDGEFNYEHHNTSYGNSKINNPVAMATLIEDQMVSIQMLGTGYISYEFFKGFSFQSQGSWNYNNYVRNYYYPAALPNSTNRMPPSVPTAEMRTKNKFTWVWENTLNYKKKFGEHAITGIGGWTAQKYVYNFSHIAATDLPLNDLLHTIPNTAVTTANNSGKEEWSLLSGLARGQYSYADRYLFSAAIRADGSSRFGQNNKWGYFPSVSGAWYVSEEDFMKYVPQISKLKLRASWGVTGNMSIGNYASYGIVNGDNYVFGGVESIGMKENSYGSPDIGWEKTSQVNLGLELGLFKWLGVEVDVYSGTTTDMLLEVPVMESSGWSTVLQNIGKLTNKGVEITLTTNHKFGKLTWTNSLNYALNRNRVESLGGDAQEILSTSNSVIDFITKVGEPIGNYYTYVVDGVYQNQAEIDADVANGITVPNARPGDLRFKKYGENDIIDADDKAITGNYLPDFTYGYSTALKYRGFDFSLSLQGVYGNEIANIHRRYLANMEGNHNQMTLVLDRWVSEAQPGNGSTYRANRTATGMNSSVSTWHIEDGSYLRIREITLGYSLPKATLRAIGMSSLRVYMSAFNPFTFTKYSGYNPEVSLNSNPLMPGVDYGTYPLAKSVVFGLVFSL
jgi:TonB-linked SusC/RagA family outer membrane protein